MDTKALDAKYLGRDVPPTPVEIVKSKGCVLYDTTGKDYIDFLMGWNVGNLGWGIKEIEEDIRTYDGPDYVNPYYLFRPWGELAQILARITPGKLTKSFRATGGTEAVEIALQAAMGYTKRTKFISVEGAYHGHSIGAMSIGLSGFRQRYANLLPNCYTVKPPLDERAAREAEALIQKGDIAAYIAEPIILNLGVIIPDDRYYEIIQAACQKHGTLMIIDEVATGFGRTGKMFASEHYDIEPDIMCLGKALTGGYGAMGATVMTEEVAQSMAYDFIYDENRKPVIVEISYCFGDYPEFSTGYWDESLIWHDGKFLPQYFELVDLLSKEDMILPERINPSSSYKNVATNK